MHARKDNAPSGRPYELGLVAAAAIWGGAFVVLKDTLDAMDPMWVMALRFSLATLVMVLLFHGRLRRHLDIRHVRAGLAMGVPEGLGFLIQNVGLADTTPGRNAFLTATYCVMVPFVSWAVTRRRPGWGSVLAASLCLVGIGLLSLSGETGRGLGRGDLLTLVSALFFALNIIAVDRAGRDLDPMVTTTVMFVASLVICLVAAIALEPAPNLLALTPRFWASMAYVVLGSTVAALLLQNVCQRHVPPARSAILLSLESVFAVAFSVTLYGERLTPALALGFLLILVAVVISQLLGQSAS